MKQKIQILKWMADRTRPYTVNLVILILSGAVLSLTKVYMALISKDLIDSAMAGFHQKAVKAGIVVGIMVILQIAAKWVSSFLSVRTTENMSGSLKEEVYHRLTDARWTEYAGFHSGDLSTRVTGDTSIVVSGVIGGVTGAMSSIIGLGTAFVALMVLSPATALGTIILGPVTLIIGAVVGSGYMSIHEEAQKADGKYRSYLQECLEHMLVIKTFGRETKSRSRLAELQREKKRLAIKRNYTSALTNAFVMTGLWIGFLILAGWGAARVLNSGLTVGTVTAYLQLILQIISPFMELAALLSAFYSATGSAKRLMELESMGTEGKNDKKEIEDFEEILLKEISFSYKADKPVLKSVSATFKQGDIIALTGSSGEGKTTLIYLLMQLIQPDTGHINVRSKEAFYDLNRHFIRPLIAYVPQGNTLFSGTIEDNLKVGNENALRETQIEALKAACAWDFVKELPEGLDSFIGERGIGLSEGQAQRIAIARALIRKAPLLILDEATSALDVETEKAVLQNIGRLKPARTCIIITHRLSILRYCRRVLELKDGTLEEKRIEDLMAEFHESAGFAVFYKTNEVAATGVT